MTMMSASHIILYADHISGMLKKVMAGERGFYYPCSDTTFVIHNCAINFVTDVTNNVTFTCKLYFAYRGLLNYTLMQYYFHYQSNC